MTTIHEAWPFVAGDDWEITATLIDEDDAPYDLTGTPDIKWALLNDSFERVIEDDGASISVSDPPTAGQIVIRVPASETSGLAAGYYTDALRIFIGGIHSTLFTGPVYVAGDPFAAAVMTAQLGLGGTVVIPMRKKAAA
jgi:hypothetical protein